MYCIINYSFAFTQLPDYLITGKIGASVELSPTGNAFTIGRILENGPVHSAGIKSGTEITLIDDQTFSFAKKELLLAQLEGTVGSPIIIGNSNHTYLLTREALNVPVDMGGPCVKGNCQNGEAVMHYPTPFENYGTYSGTVEYGLPNGLGTLSQTDNPTAPPYYTGYFRNGLYHGAGTGLYALPFYTYGGNMASYSGNWVDGRPEGNGKLTYSDGSTLEGIFLPEFVLNATLKIKNGRTYLNGRVYDYREILCYDADSKSLVWYDLPADAEGVASTCTVGNCLNGEGKSETHDGQIYTGTFQNGFPHGKGSLQTTDGNVYTGDFYFDFQHGIGTIKYYEGSTYSGGWFYGNRSGIGTLTLSGGYVYEGMFAQNLPNGSGTAKYTDGSVYTGSFLNSKPHGHGTLTHPDGVISTGDFENGKMHGRIMRTTAGGSIQVWDYENDNPIRLVDLIWSADDWQRNQQQIDAERKLFAEKETETHSNSTAPPVVSKAKAFAAIEYLSKIYPDAIADILNIHKVNGWDKISIQNSIVWNIEVLKDAKTYMRKSADCIYTLYAYFYHNNCPTASDRFHSMYNSADELAQISIDIYESYRSCANNYFSSSAQNNEFYKSSMRFKAKAETLLLMIKGINNIVQQCQ